MEHWLTLRYEIYWTLLKDCPIVWCGNEGTATFVFFKHLICNLQSGKYGYSIIQVFLNSMYMLKKGFYLKKKK